MWHGNALATANALKPTIRATLLNYLHFPQALMIPPFSVLYLTVVCRTASCALLGFFQVWRPAFEVRSKILFYLRIPDQLFQRECFIWLTILFSMPHHTFLHGNGERKCSGKQFGPKFLGAAAGGSQHPAWLAAWQRRAGVPRLSLTGVCENGTLLIWESQHLGTQSVMGYWCPETISFLEPARSHSQGWLPSAPPAALAAVPSCRESQSAQLLWVHLPKRSSPAEKPCRSFIQWKTSALQGSKWTCVLSVWIE